MNAQKHFTDAHTWQRCEVRAMAVWVLITTLVVGYRRRSVLISDGMALSYCLAYAQTLFVMASSTEAGII